MMFPLVLDLAADGVPVTVTCRILHPSLLQMEESTGHAKRLG